MSAADEYRIDLGAYVLGALDPQERSELEAHLAGCLECRAELITMAGLPGLLRGVSEEEVLGTSVEDVEPDTSGLADRALAGLRRERAAASRRRRTVLLVAATVLGVLLAGGLVRAFWPQGAMVSATDRATGVHAVVHMVDSQAGTKLKLELDGVPEEQRCLMVAVGLDGTRQTTSAWTANYEGEAEVVGSTWIPTWRMAAVEIVTPEGETLVRVPVA